MTIFGEETFCTPLLGIWYIQNLEKEDLAQLLKRLRWPLGNVDKIIWVCDGSYCALLVAYIHNVGRIQNGTDNFTSKRQFHPFATLLIIYIKIKMIND